MNRRQVGAVPAKDAVVPPLGLCGTGPVRARSGEASQLRDTTTFMSSDKESQGSVGGGFFFFLRAFYRRCTAGLSVRACRRASASKAVQQSAR